MSLRLSPGIAKTSHTAYSNLPGGSRQALLRHVSNTHHIPPLWLGALTLATSTLA